MGHLRDRPCLWPLCSKEVGHSSSVNPAVLCWETRKPGNSPISSHFTTASAGSQHVPLPAFETKRGGSHAWLAALPPHPWLLAAGEPRYVPCGISDAMGPSGIPFSCTVSREVSAAQTHRHGWAWSSVLLPLGDAASGLNLPSELTGDEALCLSVLRPSSCWSHRGQCLLRSFLVLIENRL